VKASLVSATSLLALLIANDGPALATPTYTVTASTNSINFGYELVGQSTVTSTAGFTVSETGSNRASTTLTFGGVASPFVMSGGSATTVLGSNSYPDTVTRSFLFGPLTTGAASTVITGTDSGNSSSPGKITLTGTGVAPIESVSTSSTNVSYVRVGTSATSTITISNTGNGDLATGGSATSANNLNGLVTVTLAGGMSAGTGASNSSTFNISNITTGGANTSTLTYTYTPTATTNGTVSSTISLAFSNGSPNGNNTATASKTVFVDQAVGPQFSSAINSTSSKTGGTITNLTSTGIGGAVAAANGTISFGSVGFSKSNTLWLDISNLATTPGGAAASLTSLSITNFSISGAGAAYYSIGGGGTITAGDELEIPITVMNTYGAGVLNSTLTIFTDEGAANGGTGDTFTYALTAMAVPEPASMAIVGAGLAGLAGLRRRRKAVSN
jgi:PEP-CTERM motif